MANLQQQDGAPEAIHTSFSQYKHRTVVPSSASRVTMLLSMSAVWKNLLRRFMDTPAWKQHKPEKKQLYLKHGHAVQSLHNTRYKLQYNDTQVFNVCSKTVQQSAESTAWH